MSDRSERACARCGSLLHHEDDYRCDSRYYGYEIDQLRTKLAAAESALAQEREKREAAERRVRDLEYALQPFGVPHVGDDVKTVVIRVRPEDAVKAWEVLHAPPPTEASTEPAQPSPVGYPATWGCTCETNDRDDIVRVNESCNVHGFASDAAPPPPPTEARTEPAPCDDPDCCCACSRCQHGPSPGAQPASDAAPPPPSDEGRAVERELLVLRMLGHLVRKSRLHLRHPKPYQEDCDGCAIDAAIEEWLSIRAARTPADDGDGGAK